MFVVVVNSAAHSGFVAEIDNSPRAKAEICGSHGTIIKESMIKTEADRVLAEWLRCPAADNGYYCYTHNPTGGF